MAPIPRLAALALAAALIALAAAPALARAGTLPLPVMVERGGLVVRAERGLEEDAERTAARAPAVFAEIRRDLPDLPAPPKVEVRLVKQAEDLGAASPPGRAPPPWAAGVAYPDLGVVVVALRRGPDFLGLDSTVDHELAHLALDAALGGRAPRWLSEGFSFLHSSDSSFARARTLTGMAWSGDVIPLSELDRSFPRREMAASRAYAQAYDFVVFLARRGRYPDPADDGDRWAFRDFLAAIAAGKSPDQAAREVYNASLRELADEWYQDLRSRYMTLPVGLFGIGIWVFGAFLLVLAYLRRRRQGREKLARWAEEEAAAAPDAPG